MRWTPGGKSSNIEDRRGGGMGRLGMGGGGVILLVLSLLFGRDFLSESGVSLEGASAANDTGPVNQTPEEAKMVEFVSYVLDDAQAVWGRLLPAHGAQYREAKLVLFRGATQSACGVGQSAMGPFYCGNDEKVYLDLNFFDALAARFGAPGDFAQAYVIAHEIGHHVQTILGTSGEVHRLQESRPGSANQLSVMLELQADCYAGVWGASSNQRQVLEAGDVEEGLRAASAIGDDRIQSQTQGTVRPESFTHGSSAQRVAWFKRGLQSGNPGLCDTFKGQ